MNSLKKLLFGLEKRFKVSAFVAPLLIMGEVLLEVLIPLIMARIIDVGISNHDVKYVVKYGLIMILAALASLGFGVFAGRYAAVASVGFARNIRRRLFNKIQDFFISIIKIVNRKIPYLTNIIFYISRIFFTYITFSFN